MNNGITNRKRKKMKIALDFFGMLVFVAVSIVWLWILGGQN